MSRSDPEQFLKSDDILRSIWKLTLPMMVSGFVASLYNVIDSIFVGKYVGDLALAALAVNNTIQVSLIALGSLFAVGLSSIISRSLGSGNKEKARKVLITGIILGIFFTIILAWTMLFNLDKVLLFIGSPREVLAYSRQYGGVILWFAFVGPVNDMLSSALRATGNSHWIMSLMLTGAAINIVLDAVFIIVFGWGVPGAAIATVIAQFVVFFTASFIVSGIYRIKISPNLLKEVDLPLFGEIAYVGFPSCVKSSVFVVMHLAANRALTQFGAEAIAAFGVVYKILQLAYQPIFSFNLGVQPLVGYSYGAKNYAKVRRVINTAMAVVLILGIFPAAFFMIAPSPIFELFTTSDVIIAYIRDASFIVGTTFVLYGFQMVGTGSEMAMGHSWESLLMACFRPAILVAIMTILPPLIGVRGVWFAYPVTDILSSSLIFWMLSREYKKLSAKDLLT